MVITIPRNDKGYTLDITVMKTATLPQDLTDYSVTLKAWEGGEPDVLIINGACSKDAGAGGVCHYTITPQVAGTYNAEIELTAGGTVVQSSVPFTLVISESG